MSTLVVVESPAKAKTINKYLGRDYKVIASMGHVRDLPKSKLGVDVDEGFEPEYVVIPTRAKVVKELKDAAKAAEIVSINTVALIVPRGMPSAAWAKSNTSFHSCASWWLSSLGR